MSLTPGSVSKLSPYSNRISKSLLTPCRRVGLSRKRKTPSSITKFLSNDLNNSKCSLLEETISETTPINKKSNVTRKSKVVFDSHKETTSENSEITKTEHRAKKSLNNCFKQETYVPSEIYKESIEHINSSNKVVNISNEEPVNVDECSVSLINKDYETESLLHHPLDNNGVEKTNGTICKSLNLLHVKNDSSIELDSISCEFTDLKDQMVNIEYCKENISEKGIKSNTFKKNHNEVRDEINEQVNTDVGCDLKVQENLAKLKPHEKPILAEKNESNVIKNCKIYISKLSEEDIATLKGDPTSIPLSDEEEEEIITVKKKKKTILLDDDDEDDDFHGYSKRIYQKVNTQSPKKSKEKKTSNEKKTSKEKRKMRRISSIASVSTIEDDDDAFTSTPDREKNEKQDLIVRIKELENIIRDKKTKVDNLRRASVYKSKHNIEELKNITEKWRQGCISGLNGLLNQLQTHGPIDMPTLLRNLQIPNEVISKVFVGVT
ncbi:uncharacterized protein LOC126880197 [Diabrotica virgifera virgifera]|uniref:Protein OBERON 4-like n=1 Tax=Diabrotica virgifera virgifera TaxID=50390 RepID=A0A6P7GVN6_DIAVI|nr:uncharacterized protein LOC126880197 [Diabrotica virgifera virgifera]